MNGKNVKVEYVDTKGKNRVITYKADKKELGIMSMEIGYWQSNLTFYTISKGVWFIDED